MQALVPGLTAICLVAAFYLQFVGLYFQRDNLQCFSYGTLGHYMCFKFYFYFLFFIFYFFISWSNFMDGPLA